MRTTLRTSTTAWRTRINVATYHIDELREGRNRAAEYMYNENLTGAIVETTPRRFISAVYSLKIYYVAKRMDGVLIHRLLCTIEDEANLSILIPFAKEFCRIHVIMFVDGVRKSLHNKRLNGVLVHRLHTNKGERQ